MKAQIKDNETLSSLRPLELAEYLGTNGWTQGAGTVLGGKATLWIFRSSDNLEYEILIPREISLRDYPMRVSEALKTLEVVEQRSQLEILSDISTSSADIIRIPIQTGTSRDGSISIENGIKLVERARDMMMAAACSTVEPKPYFHARKPAQATEYVSNLRLGQTERGSFVLRIISRVPPSLSPDRSGQMNLDVDDPFERKVTNTLSSALNSLRSAAERFAIGDDRDMESFRDGISTGISANLCEAIADINRINDGNSDILLNIAWAKTRPRPVNVLNSYSIPVDAIPIISEAGRIFRETSPREAFELHGVVTKLERPEGGTSGKITVWGMVEEQNRKVTIELPESDYNSAIHAHKDGSTVSCLGDIIKRGSAFIMENQRNFRVVPDP